MEFYIGMLIGALVYGLALFLISKYWRVPIVAFFWLLGWNDRRRSKVYKSDKTQWAFKNGSKILFSGEVMGGKLEMFTGSTPQEESTWLKDRFLNEKPNFNELYSGKFYSNKGFTECMHGVTKGNCFLCDD